jgi:hypothetical protein
LMLGLRRRLRRGFEGKVGSFELLGEERFVCGRV